MKTKVSLTSVKSQDIEWLRLQRNDPVQYRYFRQDKPISEYEQKMWWRTRGSNWNYCRPFIVTDETGNRIGYVGFSPYSGYARRAEFGIFIVKEQQGKGYGKAALLELLTLGFDCWNLATIYSDCLDYPGEDRFGFYKSLGFKAHDPAHQNLRYKKQGQWIPSIRFYMTKEMWDKRNAENGQAVVGQQATPAAGPEAGKARKGARVSASPKNVNAIS